MEVRLQGARLRDKDRRKIEREREEYDKIEREKTRTARE